MSNKKEINGHLGWSQHPPDNPTTKLKKKKQKKN